MVNQKICEKIEKISKEILDRFKELNMQSGQNIQALIGKMEKKKELIG